MELNEAYPHNDKKKWKNRNYVSKWYENVNMETLQQNFLLLTFQSLPFEEQKKLLGFSMIDPFDGKQPDSEEEAEHRESLRQQNYIEFNSEIII